MSVFTQKLIISCPSHFQVKYGGAIQDIFTPSGHIQLIVPPENYARIEEGEQSKFYDFFRGTGVSINPRRVGMNITVTDQRFEIRLALEELTALSLSTGYHNYVPITIQDYCRPEWQDYQNGYTVRVGKIDGFDDGSKGGGVLKNGYRKCDGTETQIGSQLYGGGFKFRFLELDSRLLA